MRIVIPYLFDIECSGHVILSVLHIDGCPESLFEKQEGFPTSGNDNKKGKLPLRFSSA